MSTHIPALIQDGPRLFAATYGQGVFLSTDNGATWDTANPGLSTDYVYCLLAANGNVFAATDAHVYHSSNSGVSWEPETAGFNYPSIRTLAPFGAALAAGGNNSLYVSTDNGLHWSDKSDGLSAIADVYALAATGTDLYAGLIPGGVWRRPIAEMLTSVDTRETGGVPVAFSLESFPNPFNPSTSLRLGLPSAAHLRLSIYDVLGREVATLVDGQVPAGYRTFTWNASARSSGAYYARAIAMDPLGRQLFTTVRKLLLIK